MRYYIEGNGYYLLFSDKSLLRALFSAWNYEANLWIVPPKTTMRQVDNEFTSLDTNWIFSPGDIHCNGLEEYGYRITTDEEADELYKGENKLIEIKTGEILDSDDFDLRELKYRD